MAEKQMKTEIAKPRNNIKFSTDTSKITLNKAVAITKVNVCFSEILKNQFLFNTKTHNY